MDCRLAYGALACLFVLAAGVTPSRASEAPGRSAVLLGSSSVGGQLGHALVRQLGEMGIDVTTRRRSASGLARPDFFNWPRAIRRAPSLSNHQGVMVLLGGNDTQPIRLMRGRRRIGTVRWDHEARWRETYAALVQGLVSTLCDRGARRVLWLVPPNPGRTGWTERMARVRQVQTEAAAGATCADGTQRVTVIDADRVGLFTRVHSNDGVHLNRRGARVYWQRVGQAVLDALDAPEPTPPPAPEPTAPPAPASDPEPHG